MFLLFNPSVTTVSAFKCGVKSIFDISYHCCINVIGFSRTTATGLEQMCWPYLIIIVHEHARKNHLIYKSCFFNRAIWINWPEQTGLRRYERGVLDGLIMDYMGTTVEICAHKFLFKSFTPMSTTSCNNLLGFLT